MSKVFVTGCFDGCHSGHVRFLEIASSYGDLYVAIGSDSTVLDLKRRFPMCPEAERLYVISSLVFVKKAVISSGSGLLDFKNEFIDIKPDIFITNEDGDMPCKREFCERNGVEYIVLKREPCENLPVRSTTELRKINNIPFRVDLAGGWLDHGFVSKHCSGPVITINLEPTVEFQERCGMATSTRRRAIELWGNDLPIIYHPQKLAKILFCYDNPPGTKEISGSQDALGTILPGINRLEYNNNYWPEEIESIHDEETIKWLEGCVRLVLSTPRKDGYNVFENMDITKEKAIALSKSSKKCWDAIKKRNIVQLGESVREAFDAQVSLFPNILSDDVKSCLKDYEGVLGYKVAGAGGGGYIILITEMDVGIPITIRRKNHL